MKGIIDKVLKFLGIAVFGVGIGIPVMVICKSAMGGYNETITEIIVWIFASTLCSLFGSVFFIDKFNFLISTIIHCIGCFAVAMSACAICGYIDSIYTILAEILPIFVIVYSVLYLVGITIAKIEAKQINDMLNK